MPADAWQTGLWPQSRRQHMHALPGESSPAAHRAARPPASPLRSSNLLLDHCGRCRLLLYRLLVDLMLLPAAASLQEQLLWSRSPVMNLRGYGRLRQNMKPSNYCDKSGQLWRGSTLASHSTDLSRSHDKQRAGRAPIQRPEGLHHQGNPLSPAVIALAMIPAQNLATCQERLETVP